MIGLESDKNVKIFQLATRVWERKLTFYLGWLPKCLLIKQLQIDVKTPPPLRLKRLFFLWDCLAFSERQILMQQNRNYCKLISKTFGKFLFHVLHPLNSRCITLIISIQKGRWEFEEKKHKLFEIEIDCEFAAEMIVKAVSWLVWFHVNVLTKDTLLKNILMRSFCFDVFPVLKCCFISLKYKMCCNNYNGRTGDDHLLGIQTPETLRKGGMKKNFTECMTNGKTCTISQVELSSRRHF